MFCYSCMLCLLVFHFLNNTKICSQFIYSFYLKEQSYTVPSTSTRQLSVSNAQSALGCIKKLKHAVIKLSSVCQTKVFEGAQSSVFHCVKLDCCWYKPLPIERARVLSVLLLWKFVWPEVSKCISFGQWPWRCGFRQTAVVRGGGWDATCENVFHQCLLGTVCWSS